MLRKDGTIWVNLGDSYASSPPGCGKDGVSKSSTLHGQISEVYRETLRNSVGQKRNTVVGNLKPKDLCGIPWRVAFALQSDGWYLRSDIIWVKPNPMPESVTDRPTKAHEYIFLLSKSPRYYWDQEAVREESIDGYRVNPHHLPRTGRKAQSSGVWRGCGDNKEQVERGSDWTETSYKPEWKRNLRSVWTIPTCPTPEAHFATYPPKLVEKCVLAGCPEGGVVLDPFMGSGTTARVCETLLRRWIGIELSEKYVREIACKKLEYERQQKNWVKAQVQERLI